MIATMSIAELPHEIVFGASRTLHPETNAVIHNLHESRENDEGVS
jgi:hypothetical protein